MAGDFTIGWLERSRFGDYLAPQKKYDVDITGGTISGVTLDDVTGTINTAVRIVTASGSISVASGDDFIGINKTASETTNIAIPLSTVTGRKITFKDMKGNASQYPITITPSSVLIDNETTYVINTNLASITIINNGTGWSII